MKYQTEINLLIQLLEAERRVLLYRRNRIVANIVQYQHEIDTLELEISRLRIGEPTRGSKYRKKDPVAE